MTPLAVYRPLRLGNSVWPVTEESEPRMAMSRDPELRAGTASTKRVLRLRSAANALASSRVVAVVAVVALATVIVIPGAATVEKELAPMSPAPASL